MDQSLTIQLFESKISFFLLIVPADLVVKLLPDSASLITIGNDQMLLLQPELFSYNPNVASGSASRLISNFQWFCWRLNESEPWLNTSNVHLPYTQQQLTTLTYDNGGCFRQGPGRVNVTSGTLQVYSGNFHADNYYVIKIVTSENGLLFSARLTVFSVNVPQVPTVFVE